MGHKIEVNHKTVEYVYLIALQQPIEQRGLGYSNNHNT